MSGLAFQWQIAPSGQLIPNITRWDQSILSGLAAIAQSFAPQIEAWMKANAEWVDRTGAARQGLRAFAEIAATQITIFVVHSVFYGIFLELGTRYMAPRPVIWPAIMTFGAQVMAAIRALVGR